ncbi:MAG: LPS export ABC transporter permease LptF [Albidovulum sp.]|uniref:LPS export ABC transporter permease LptF n=1 Tax=Albidovulum sp. TaxID=1872424 RepID=UPI001322328A|nr:LPS export ABC transporter permease LptF [Defluviimonas sp.]KAB2881927.1 MAG: LPS export ABC transporter permease LptF [Defluviimonas sp.]
MSKFDRYMLSQLMMLFGFFALVLVSVYWINRAVSLFDQLISDGQSAWVFLEFTALTLPNVIRLVLPVAAFVASVYVTNRLASESELVVMMATGFSPFQLARPVVYFGLAVTLMVAVLAHVLVPASRTKLAERRGEIAENVASRFLTEGTFLHPASGITFYIREISPRGELEDIFLTDARTPGRRTTYTADRALLVKSETGPKLVMFEGMAQTLATATASLSVTRFADFSYDLGALIGAAADRLPSVEELPTPVLLAASADSAAAYGTTEAAMLLEGHERIARPFLALVSALIGFATLLTGGFSRFGLWRQIALSVVLLVFVQFLANGATSLVARSSSAWPAIYLPVAAGLGIAAVLLALAGRARRVHHGLVAAVAS